jgi:hypothetical protein
MKDITTASRQLLHDIRDLQKAGLTIPDIIYNYRLVDGRLERKRYREGSQSGDEEPEPVDVQVKNFLNAKPEGKPRASTSTEPGLMSGETNYRAPLPEQYATSSSNVEKSPSQGFNQMEGEESEQSSGKTNYREPLLEQYATSSSNDEKTPSHDFNLRESAPSDAQQSSGLTVGTDIPPPYSDPMSNPRPPLPPRPLTNVITDPTQIPTVTSTSERKPSISSISPSDVSAISSRPVSIIESHPLPPIPTSTTPSIAPSTEPSTATSTIPSTTTPSDSIPPSDSSAVPTIISHPLPDAANEAAPAFKAASEIKAIPEIKPTKKISRKPVPKMEDLLKPLPEVSAEVPAEQPARDSGGLHKERNVRFGSIRVIGEGEHGRRLVGDEGKED